MFNFFKKPAEEVELTFEEKTLKAIEEVRLEDIRKKKAEERYFQHLGDTESIITELVAKYLEVLKKNGLTYKSLEKDSLLTFNDFGLAYNSSSTRLKVNFKILEDGNWAYVLPEGQNIEDYRKELSSQLYNFYLFPDYLLEKQFVYKAASYLKEKI